MRPPLRPSPTDRVALRALVDRLTGEGGGNPPGAITEQGDRRDVLINTRRYKAPGRDVSHFGTQGIAAEHLAGVRATSGHELNVGAHIAGAAVDADICRIVDAIGPYRHVRHLCAQRLDQRVCERTESGWLLSAAGEIYFRSEERRV